MNIVRCWNWHGNGSGEEFALAAVERIEGRMGKGRIREKDDEYDGANRLRCDVLPIVLMVEYDRQTADGAAFAPIEWTNRNERE